MIKVKDLANGTREKTSIGQTVIFDPKAKMKRKLTKLQQWVEEPSEGELLAENLQMVNN